MSEIIEKQEDLYKRITQKLNSNPIKLMII